MLEPWELYQALPKPPHLWSVDDVVEWLQINGLASLSSTMRDNHIDGGRLASLTQQSILTELNITSRPAVKRLMEWINLEMKEFSDYCSEQPAGGAQEVERKEQSVPSLSPVPRELARSNPSSSASSTNKENSILNSVAAITPKMNAPYLKPAKKEHPSQSSLTSINSTTATVLNLPTERAKCVLRPLQLRITSLTLKREFLLGDSAKVGRHPDCDICLAEASISRLHTVFLRKGADYYALDKSKFGTYIENPAKVEISERRAYQLHTTELYVQRLSIQKGTFEVELLHTDNNNSLHTLSQKSEYAIGRKSKDLLLQELQFAPAQYRLFLEDSKVYLQSAEGTSYTRLLENEPVRLTSCNLKIGCTSVLHCQLEYICEGCSTVISHRETGSRDMTCPGKKSK